VGVKLPRVTSREGETHLSTTGVEVFDTTLPEGFPLPPVTFAFARHNLE